MYGSVFPFGVSSHGPERSATIGAAFRCARDTETDLITSGRAHAVSSITRLARRIRSNPRKARCSALSFLVSDSLSSHARSMH